MYWQFFQKIENVEKYTDKFPKKLEMLKNVPTNFLKHWFTQKIFWQIFQKNKNFENFLTNFTKKWKFYTTCWQIVRPYANLPNSRWLVEDAQLAPCRPNLPNSGTLVELAQLTEASSDMPKSKFSVNRKT